MGGTEVTIVGMLIAAVGTLSGVVGVLYRSEHNRFDQEMIRVNNKLDDCETDRQALWERYNGLALVVAKQLGLSAEEIQARVMNESDSGDCLK